MPFEESQIMSGSIPYADPDFMQTWAHQQMERTPDFVIGDGYLKRWWIVPRNRMSNTYLHEINKSDDDRALHDHPWDNISFVIEGSYTEITPKHPEGLLREAGSVITRKATDSHRLIIPGGGRCISLFTTGPIVREWGFHCPKGWRHWKKFVANPGENHSMVGRGCD